MITRTKVMKGFASQLPSLKDRTFHFDKGLNVLFGTNGCGKSTLLKCMKAYCAVANGGWSAVSNYQSLGVGSINHFPFVYRALTPTGECDTIVEWDGTPTFYNDSDLRIDDMSWFYNKDVLKKEGLTSEAEQMDYMAKRPSSGQTRMQKLNKIFNIAKNPPEPTETSPNPGNKYEAMEIAYLRSLRRTGRVTLLLDEPEKSLSIPKQIELFRLLQKFGSEFQIIIATHSPFILFEQGLNIVEMENNYIEECKQIIKDCGKEVFNLEKDMPKQIKGKDSVDVISGIRTEYDNKINQKDIEIQRLKDTIVKITLENHA
jgi:energy-coupling factor transporter ATP-binding protein EcfA2